MTRIREIAAMPTEYNRIHESCFRSWNIVDEVLKLLGRGVPGDVVRELILEMKDGPRSELVVKP